jgi:hypothetical protein
MYLVVVYVRDNVFRCVMYSSVLPKLYENYDPKYVLGFTWTSNIIIYSI